MKRTTVLMATVALATTALLAQQPDASQIAAGMAKNQEALRQYMWQSRVDLSVDGEEKKTDLYQIRYNMDGEMEKTRVGGEAAKQKKVRGPLRKKVAKGKKKDAAEFAEAVHKQLGAYMTPQNMQKALSAAFVRKEGGSIKLRSEGVLKDGDTVELQLVEATKQPMTMTITTTVEEAPLEVMITFQKIADGPNYPAKQVVSTMFEKKKLVITTENFDYDKQS